MEQRPSWEVNSSSASQEFPSFYGTRRFITEFTRGRHLSLSWASSIPWLGSYQRIGPGPRLFCLFRNIIIFYGEGLLVPRLTPKLEDHPFSAVRDCLFNVFAATLHNWKPFLHPQPEDAPYRGDRDPLNAVSKTVNKLEDKMRSAVANLKKRFGKYLARSLMSSWCLQDNKWRTQFSCTGREKPSELPSKTGCVESFGWLTVLWTLCDRSHHLQSLCFVFFDISTTKAHVTETLTDFCILLFAGMLARIGDRPCQIFLNFLCLLGKADLVYNDRTIVTCFS
jgi:hypothetical protein